MNSVEEQLTAALRARADDDVDTAALLTAATARGRGIQRRRRWGGMAATAAGLAAVIGLATAVVGGFPMPGGSPAAGPKEDAEPAAWTLAPMPPEAEGEPTALEDPDVVGASGGLLHVTLDTLPTPFDTIYYGTRSGNLAKSAGGVEVVSLMGQGRYAEVLLASDSGPFDDRSEKFTRTSVKVGDKPATLYRPVPPKPSDNPVEPEQGSVVRWRPAPGLWAEVEFMGAMDERHLLPFAEAVRLDRVNRCVTPARLGVVPEGTTFEGCHMRFRDDQGWTASMELRRADGAALRIYVPAMVERSAEWQELNTTVAGHPANWSDGKLTLFGMSGVDVDIVGMGGYTKQDIYQVAEGLTLATDLKDPRTWPTHPFE